MFTLLSAATVCVYINTELQGTRKWSNNLRKTKQKNRTLLSLWRNEGTVALRENFEDDFQSAEAFVPPPLLPL